MGSGSEITLNQIKNILKDKVERTLLHSQHIVADTNTFIEKEVQKKLKEISAEEEKLKTQIEENYDRVLEHIEDEIKGILKKKELTLDTKSLEFKQLRKQFLELRLIRNTWKRDLLNEGEISVEDIRNQIYKKYDIQNVPEVHEEVVQKEIVVETVKSQSSRGSDSPKLSEVRDEFIRERLLSGYSPKSTSEIESTIGDLIEIVGDKPIGDFSRQDSREFKNVISRLPKHRTQTPRYRDLTIKQILNLEGVKGQEPKNINKLIYRVRIFFKWLRNNYREYVPENYFEGLSVDSKKVDKPRDGFTTEELKKIFHTSDYVYNTVRYRRNLIRLPKYFIPILGLFTGMRLDEICQLSLEDVYKEGKYDLVRVRISEDTKLKNIQSERIIPLHPTLRKLGFIDYCNYFNRKGEERVFPQLKKDRDGYGRNIGRFFNVYLKKVGVWEYQNKVFHSLRHTFITNLLQNGVREEIVNGLDGHKQKTMSTTVYFKGGFPSDVLYEEGISKLNFDGINFGKLKIDWKRYLE